METALAREGKDRNQKLGEHTIHRCEHQETSQ